MVLLLAEAMRNRGVDRRARGSTGMPEDVIVELLAGAFCDVAVLDTMCLTANATVAAATQIAVKEAAEAVGVPYARQARARVCKVRRISSR